MPELKVLACGICGRYDPAAKVRRFRLTADRDRWEADLCEEHARELLKVMDGAKTKTRGRRSLDDLMVSDPSEIPREP